MALRNKTGFTLIEMLVAMTASLILFGAVVTIFQILGDAVSKSRRAGRLESDLCSVRTRVQLDLAGVTANRDLNGLQVEVDSGSVSGYFEIIEGPNSDLLDYSVAPDRPFDRSTNAPGPTAASDDRIVGDTDDLLFFTTRILTLDPFSGLFENKTISSDGAEVAYFCRPTAGTANPTLYTLYRRQLLVIGSSPRGNFLDGSEPFTSWNDFYDKYDVSARRENNIVVLNTANDLQRRRNRFGHDPECSGGTSDLYRLIPNHPANVLALAKLRKDEDILANNVLSFDVRVLDPQAVERQGPGTVRMQPSDVSYWKDGSIAVKTTNPVHVDLGFNAFRDFHNGVGAPGVFGGYGRPQHCLIGTKSTSRTFDTWTSFYASNNQSDDGNGSVDDDAERAPYPYSLGGVQVIIRLYDPETKAVKQSTITQSFKL